VSGDERQNHTGAFAMDQRDRLADATKSFNRLCRAGLPFACAGIWLDVLTIRLGWVLTPQGAAGIGPHQIGAWDQAAAATQCLLRKMTRRLTKADWPTAIDKGRGKQFVGPTALGDIAARAGHLACTALAGDSRQDAVIELLRDAFEGASAHYLEDALTELATLGAK
jgi:hypothetical protein